MTGCVNAQSILLRENNYCNICDEPWITFSFDMLLLQIMDIVKMLETNTVYNMFASLMYHRIANVWNII